MRKILFAVLFFGLTAPAIADECPIGYTPTKYTQLEYIESTGTQYIDTGVYPNGLIKMDAHIYTSKDNGIYSAFSGVLTPSDVISGLWQVIYSYHQGIDFNVSQEEIIFDIPYIGEYTFIVDQVNKIISLNDEVKAIPTTPTSVVPGYSNIPLGKYQNYRYSGHSTYWFGKIYYVKLWDNGVFVRNFIPAKRNSDGEIGMYDTVTGHFFTNAGTGEFIAGPEILTENTCFPCPPNTYKDFVGNSDCIPCPDTFSSPSGATSINECGRILHIGDYIAHMPFGRRTEHGLCTMLDGKKYCADVYEKQ